MSKFTQQGSGRADSNPRHPCPPTLGTALLPRGSSASQGHTWALHFTAWQQHEWRGYRGPSKLERKTSEAAPPPCVRNWGVGMWIERQDPLEGAKNGPTPFLRCPLHTSVLPGHLFLVPSRTRAVVWKEPQAATMLPPWPLLGDHSALVSEDPRF